MMQASVSYNVSYKLKPSEGRCNAKFNEKENEREFEDGVPRGLNFQMFTSTSD